MAPREALEFYRSQIEDKSANTVRDMVFIPRNETIGYLVFATSND